LFRNLIVGLKAQPTIIEEFIKRICHPELWGKCFFVYVILNLIQDFKYQKIPNHLTATPTDTSSQGSLRIACSFCKVRNDMQVKQWSKELFAPVILSEAKNLKIERDSSSKSSQNDVEFEQGVLAYICPLPNKFAKAAFTLAEVLITLGIIGVVAAMTIPNLISVNQKRVIEATLKEDYSIFSQINKMMIANDVGMDLGVADGSDAAIKTWFQDNMLPYMKVSSVCYSSAGCWGKDLDTVMLNGAKFTDCRKNYGCGSNFISFIMNNGTMVALDIGNNSQLRTIFGVDSTASTCLKMYVDVNGNKKPNKFGVDIFLMTITEDGFVPAGFSKSPEQLKNSCSPGGNGYWCMSHVKNSGWVIPDDVWAQRNIR